MEYGVIVAGGAGTRLWPLSRRDRPKQLLTVGDGRSLLQLAHERLAGVVDPQRIFVCALEAHRAAILADLTVLPPDNFLGEPMGRDTAVAVGLPAAVLAARDPDAVIAVVTADHVIEPVEEFHAALRHAFDLAAAGPRLVTFGIVPTHAHTGLGYIERAGAVEAESDVAEQPEGAPAEARHVGAAYKVSAFREKPDLETATAYLESGRHLWNSGMFVWRADTLLAQLEAHLPAAATGLATIAAGWGSTERAAVLAATYVDLPAISVDYAVMEPAAGGSGPAEVVVVPLALEWLDVGSWPTLAATLECDAAGNAVGALAVLVDSADNVIVAEDPDHLVAAIGLRAMVVVSTREVTLVCPRDESQRVKELVEAVRAAHPDRYG